LAKPRSCGARGAAHRGNAAVVAVGQFLQRRALRAPSGGVFLLCRWGTEKFLARLGTAFPGTVWVGGCKNWYTSQQPTPVLWPFPQSEHKAFFEQVPPEDFQFIPSGRGA
jgi:hypothetical protein